jgi:RNA polymerase sigma-70 factor (ECF subfamily)
VRQTEVIQPEESTQDDRYTAAAAEFGAGLERLARAYEADPERRRDLLQDIHLQLWRSFAAFDGRCSTRTWVYRVAHNTAASYVIRERRQRSRLITFEELEKIPTEQPAEPAADRRRALEKLHLLIQQLAPTDRQVMICYLEDMDAASIGEITGLSPGNVAMKIHRLRNVLSRRFHEGGWHE